MAKPNYQFEKRQKDLAKKRKKEEKSQRKALPKTDTAHEDNPGEGEVPPNAGPDSAPDQK